MKDSCTHQISLSGNYQENSITACEIDLCFLLHFYYLQSYPVSGLLPFFCQLFGMTIQNHSVLTNFQTSFLALFQRICRNNLCMNRKYHVCSSVCRRVRIHKPVVFSNSLPIRLLLTRLSMLGKFVHKYFKQKMTCAI